MRFIPYSDAASVPNIIVDGSRAKATVLTLSHWPRSGTPPELRADTSTAIVFKYLDAPAFHVNVEGLSNNHFDEDGLLGIYALLNRSDAERHRDLLIDSASAGDFGVFATRDAARVAFTVSAYGDAGTSPLPSEIFRRPYPELAASLYTAVLDVLPGLLDNPEHYRKLWEPQDAALTAGETLLDTGVVTIEERPELDLAIVRGPAHVTVHSSALYNRTACNRVLLLRGAEAELRYRYESWVQMASRRPLPRVDLTGLADELSQLETGGTRWEFDGVDALSPTLHLEGTAGTSIEPDVLVARVERYLRAAPPAWDPYAG